VLTVIAAIGAAALTDWHVCVCQALFAFGTLVQKLHTFHPSLAAREVASLGECFGRLNHADVGTHSRRLREATLSAHEEWETLSPSKQETWLRMQAPLHGVAAHAVWKRASDVQRWEWVHNAKQDFVRRSVHDVAVRFHRFCVSHKL